MSFGALSANAIRALNGGAKRGGFYHDTGEGGISPYHLEAGGDIEACAKACDCVADAAKKAGLGASLKGGADVPPETRARLIAAAIALFERAESDALVVVDSLESRNVIGLLTEQHALRRYSEELDRSRRELSGET